MKYFSQETRARMAASAKRRWADPGERAKSSDAHRAHIDDIRLVELYQGGMTQEEVGRALGVSQKVIWRALMRVGIAARIAAKRDQAGASNHSWKGDDASYKALHLRVYSLRGAPSLCEHCGAAGPDRPYEWANVSGHYEDVFDYIRLCKRCHRRFDDPRCNRDEPARHCGFCGQAIARREQAPGLLESPARYRLRKFCNRACFAGGRRHATR